MTLVRRVLAVLLVGLLSATTLSKATEELRVVTFNILAPCWVSEERYPTIFPSFLDRMTRREKIISYLNSEASNLDIIALQETSVYEFAFIKDFFASEFYAFETHHEPDYWASWRLPETPWEPNGVAILARKSMFREPRFRDVRLGLVGNHAAYFEAQTVFGKFVRAISVHLDPEFDGRRQEFDSLLKVLPNADTIDVIAGDFNTNTELEMKELLEGQGFTNVLAKLGRLEATHPFDSEYQGYEHELIIDHVLVRNGKASDGGVVHLDVWSRFDNETERALEIMRVFGSDHFPVLATIGMQ